MYRTVMEPGRSTQPSPAVEVLDLRGVACPLNWARARVRLDQMEPGAALELVLDDPKGARDIPRAAEALGYVVATSEQRGANWHLRIVI